MCTVVLKFDGRFRFLDFPGVRTVQKSYLSNGFVDFIDDNHVVQASLCVENMIGIFANSQKAVAAVTVGNLISDEAKNDEPAR